jgi:multidrug resistance protein MdtO
LRIGGTGVKTGTAQAISAENPRSPGWIEWLVALLAEELAPRPLRFRSSLRMAVIAAIGAGLIAACHVQTVLGAYVVWLMLGSGPMLSLRRAAGFLVIAAAVLAASVPLAAMLSETPWLMLPFIAGFTAIATYLNLAWKLSAMGLVLEVVTLDTFYGVMFGPESFASGVAAVYGGCVIAFGLITLFDNWLWPDPGETILLESLKGSIQHNRSRLAWICAFYLGSIGDHPPEPTPVSQTASQLALLDRASAEGTSADRRAVLLAAITRIARIHIAVDAMAVTARESVPRVARDILREAIQAAADAIVAAMDEIAAEVETGIRTGADAPSSPAAAAIAPKMEALDRRIAQARPSYIGRAGAAELANLSAFTDSLHALARLLERPLDELPPSAAPAPIAKAAQPDSALRRYCAKSALCMVIGYIAGIISHEAAMSVILTTVIITALPTYGASLRKMILRIAGTVVGGAIAIIAIIIVTPNFETLPSYMLALFVVLAISAYASLSSGRVAYAGKSIGTTFVLVFAGLSPSEAVSEPLWRVWGILLGTVIVTVVFIILWPEYAADSLLPRIRKVLRDTLSLAPRPAMGTETEIRATSAEITHLLGEILEVADDARLEGRKSLIDHDAVVEAAGTLRRIAHRLAAISINSAANPRSPLSEPVEQARATAIDAIVARLRTWLAFFDSRENLVRRAAAAIVSSESRPGIAEPLREYSARLEANSFAEIQDMTIERRRLILAELQSLRRLEILMGELDRYLAAVPGGAAESPPSVAMLTPDSRPG